MTLYFGASHARAIINANLIAIFITLFCRFQNFSFHVNHTYAFWISINILKIMNLQTFHALNVPERTEKSF